MSERFENGFGGLVAVVTGGGTGMGRELVRQLTAQGCDVATCDVMPDTMGETVNICSMDGNPGKIMTFVADVSVEKDILAFRDAVAQWRPHVHILFNNAGIGGGGSIVTDERAGWEKTFNVCWGGVYYGTRAFLPLLLAAPFGQVVNTSSVNGFWASLGPKTSHTAYAAAKFAVKGFTEALIADFRVNAPTLRASVVMPGHIGTNIAINSSKLNGVDPDRMTEDQEQKVRARMEKVGVDTSSFSSDELRALLKLGAEGFRDNAPIDGAQAADIILKAVMNNEWRILVGEDAKILDEVVRQYPFDAYEPEFVERLHERGIMQGITR